MDSRGRLSLQDINTFLKNQINCYFGKIRFVIETTFPRLGFGVRGPNSKATVTFATVAFVLYQIFYAFNATVIIDFCY